MSLVNRLNKESLKVIREAYSQVEEEFFKNPREVKESYEKVCRYLGIIKSKVCKNEFQIGKTTIEILVKEFGKNIVKDEYYCNEVVDKIYGILTEIEKQNKKYESLYRNLLLVYFNFSKSMGVKPRRSQLGLWETALKGKEISLVNLRLHNYVTPLK